MKEKYQLNLTKKGAKITRTSQAVNVTLNGKTRKILYRTDTQDGETIEDFVGMEFFPASIRDNLAQKIRFLCAKDYNISAGGMTL